MSKPKILVFASGGKESGGGGSGFQKLVEASRAGILDADIVGVVSNHPNGGVRTKAEKLGIRFIYFPGPWTAEQYQRIAIESGAEFFALSGWLKFVKGLDPNTPFNSRVVFNIHPGDLPMFGGNGMHGHHVHEAVAAACQRGTITHSAVCMHFVTEVGYDVGGPIFLRVRVPINKGDPPDKIGRLVNQQEHIWQPPTTNLVVHRKIWWDGISPNSLQVPSDYLITQDA